MSRKTNYYNEVRNANERLWEAINTLVSLQREWQAMDYGNTLGDGDGPHEGVTRNELGAVVFDTTNAMVAVLNAGHSTNMAKLLH